MENFWRRARPYHRGVQRYGFGQFEVDVAAAEIRRDGVSVPVEPQVFDVLVVLLREHQRVVTKHELLDEVWGTRFVGESALTSRIKALRRALGDDGRTQAVIRTAHGHGFRFVAELHEVDAAWSTATSTAGAARVVQIAAPTLQQDVRFCTADDGSRLAYAWMGSGPPLVKVANWLTHLEYDLESPIWRHWLTELSGRFSLLRYDERGSGLSDLATQTFTFEAWVNDLEAVVDAADLDRFPLLGISQGAGVAVAFAARHPERVSKLVLYGGYTRGPVRRAQTDEARREAELMPELAALGWGREDPIFRQVFTMRFLPNGTPQEWQHLNDLQRRTTTPENAARFLARSTRSTSSSSRRRSERRHWCCTHGATACPGWRRGGAWPG